MTPWAYPACLASEPCLKFNKQSRSDSSLRSPNEVDIFRFVYLVYCFSYGATFCVWVLGRQRSSLYSLWSLNHIFQNCASLLLQTHIHTYIYRRICCEWFSFSLDVPHLFSSIQSHSWTPLATFALKALRTLSLSDFNRNLLPLSLWQLFVIHSHQVTKTQFIHFDSILPLIRILYPE